MAGLPELACDSHIHFYGPAAAYPLEHEPAYAVPEATPEQFIDLQGTVGMTRAVVVHAAATGRDNRRTLDALRAYPARFRGVLTPPPLLPDTTTLRQWDELGVRGMRFTYFRNPGTTGHLTPEHLRILQETGWHAQLHVGDNQVAELASWISRLPCPVVIDHLARIPASTGIDGAAFQALQRLLDTGKVWVKLSAPMRCSQAPGLEYADVQPFVRKLVAQAPERLLWGSDWPNVNHPGPIPGYADLLALFLAWVPEQHLRQRILADNAETLYRFCVA